VNEPSDRVGTELVFENEAVRVWIMDLKPGEDSPFHKHVADYVIIYTTPSKIQVHIPGEPERTDVFDDGYVAYTNVGDGIMHSITNVASESHRQVIVELKQSTRQASSATNGRVRPA
jgi:predicted metal-dependent enzyme (double-stranded beta helix superfamily)